MKITPSKKFIICTNPSESKSKSGLIISDPEKGKKPELGVVYAIGEGKVPMDIKVGDRIVFRRYADNRISIDGQEYNFISFKDIVGVVSQE